MAKLAGTWRTSSRGRRTNDNRGGELDFWGFLRGRSKAARSTSPVPQEASEPTRAWTFTERTGHPPLSEALRSVSTSYQVILFDQFARYADIAGKRVLEIGSDGQLCTARMFAELGASEVHACNLFDIFDRSVTGDRIHLHVGDAGKLDLGDKPFDIIYGIALLEHVPDYGPLVDTVRRLLAPDGVAYLHGDPFWTAPYGHHVYCVADGTPGGVKYKFHDPETNPIPSWAHLVTPPEEMSEFLRNKGLPPNEVSEIVTFVYGLETYVHGNCSNQKTPSEVRRAFEEVFDVHPFYARDETEPNAHFDAARKVYEEHDLRTRGLSLWMRHKAGRNTAARDTLGSGGET